MFSHRGWLVICFSLWILHFSESVADTIIKMISLNITFPFSWNWIKYLEWYVAILSQFYCFQRYSIFFPDVFKTVNFLCLIIDFEAKKCPFTNYYYLISFFSRYLIHKQVMLQFYFFNVLLLKWIFWKSLGIFYIP